MRLHFILALSLLSASTLRAQDLAAVPSTAALYSFSEGTGGTAADLSGNGHTGSLQGATAGWTPGGAGTTALDLPGADDLVNLSPAVTVGSTWTIQAWTRFPLSVAGWDSWRTLAQNGPNRHHILVNDDGSLGVWNFGFYPSGYNVNSLGGWHLLSAVGSGGQTLFYIDGNYVGTSNAQETTAVTRIGNHYDSGNAGQNWGAIDSVRITTTARTPAEIATDANPTPMTPTAPAQTDLGGATVNPAGSVHAGFIAKATVSHPQGTLTRIQVEMKPVGTPFDGTTNLHEGAPVASGGQASAQVSGISSGTWHWRARAIDALGVASAAWICFGTDPDDVNENDIGFTNAAPGSGSAVQRHPGSGLVLANGGWVFSSDGMRFEATATDPDGDALKMEVEVKPAGTAFSGQPTTTGPLAAAGSVASCTISDLDSGTYGWRWRTLDSMGLASGWTAHGGGAVATADFRLVETGSKGVSGCQLTGGGAAWVLALLAAFALVGFRKY